MNLIEKANAIFLENFPAETWFERAVFFSWYCDIHDCTYCYMSTGKHTKNATRSQESLLAEVILCKQLGWKFGFLSGGQKAFSQQDFAELLKNIHKIHGEKIWINVGALDKQQLEQYKPYIKGVVGAIETVNPKLHDKVCPSKPIAPFEKMFKLADELGLMKAMTIIIGLGETIEDFKHLERFIKDNGISKIHIYSLNPQKGTEYENAKPPTAEYQAEWIAKTRIAFPKIDIQAGIWVNKVKTVSLLLKAGANSISKFPAIRQFNSEAAKEIENQAKLAGRTFKGTLTKLLKFKIDENISDEVRKKLDKYIATLQKRAT